MSTGEADRRSGAVRIVAVGVVSLAVAMGIGRFAFTPLLPLMVRDHAIDAAMGPEWAAANYAGYLVGAMTAARMGRRTLSSLRAALVGVALSTMLVAFVEGALLGATLRFLAGVFSAWVLVLASSWCLAELVHRGEVRAGSWIYTGVGIGIALAGIVAWLGGMQAARLLWLELGLLAALGAAYVLAALPRTSTGPAESSRIAHGGAPAESWKLVVCYGAFGFGYIVPATFLPALAREQVHDPLVFGVTWPLFGFAAALSVALVARLLSATPRRRLWAVAQGLMAVGTGLPVVSQSLWSLALSAVLVGGTLMIITMAGLQMASESMPRDPTRLLARMTAAFAAGQVAGPLLVRALQLRPATEAGDVSVASALAALALALTALWLWRGKASP